MVAPGTYLGKLFLVIAKRAIEKAFVFHQLLYEFVCSDHHLFGRFLLVF